MKSDNQHLDFLISQYMDGCLDSASKKSLEQQMLTDPEARELYKGQRDVQDLLDDWGNRIPMIHWDEFDQQLSLRLEKETIGSVTGLKIHRWTRRFAVAAALVVAASIGYGWHAMTTPNVSHTMVASNMVPNTASKNSVIPEDETAMGSGSLTRFRVDESDPAPQTAMASNTVNISSPSNVDASEALRQAVGFGMSPLGQTARANVTSASSVHVAEALPEKKADDGHNGPIYP